MLEKLGALDLSGRVAIVTGAMGGIGWETAKRFASHGARVVLADRQEAIDKGRAMNAVEACKASGAADAIVVACNVVNEDDVIAAVTTTIERFSRLDIVVNAAGKMLFKSIEDYSADEWRKLLDVNFMGAVFFTREALKTMSMGSAIVNVSSIHAIQTSALVAPYAAAKAALVSLTRSTAIEGKSKGIRANTILPGAVDTPMLWSNPNVVSGVERISPGGIGKAEDIASTIVFLASPAAEFMTGAAIVVDGGRLATL